MKRLLAVLLFATTPTYAGTPVVACAFENGEYFTAVGQGLTATIRWNEDGEFQPADVIWREPYLTVLQFNDGNSFRLVLNTKNGDAVGQLIVGETGRRETGKMICKTGEVE